jgi:hypothetical protein
MRSNIRSWALATALGLVLGAASQAPAGSITTLFSTGVDAGGALLPDGAVDPHYTVTGGGHGPDTFVIGNPALIPWVGNTAGSQWITPVPDTRAGAGPFTYTTTFDLTGFNPATASISGEWSSDNQATMSLNGTLVAVDAFPGWTTIVPFSISSGFIAGVNTLTFDVPNGSGAGDGPTGLQVHIIGATANAVPEPSSIALAGCGLLMAGGLAWRRRRVATA